MVETEPLDLQGWLQLGVFSGLVVTMFRWLLGRESKRDEHRQQNTEALIGTLRTAVEQGTRQLEHFASFEAAEQESHDAIGRGLSELARDLSTLTESVDRLREDVLRGGGDG